MHDPTARTAYIQSADGPTRQTPINTTTLPNHSQVASILRITPMRVAFSLAAATRSLSPNCLFTASSVLCVPALRRTSTRYRGGNACSNRTRTPSPITVASEQWLIVGVSSTTTVWIVEFAEAGGRMWMSGRLTTANEPRESGCSGSEMGEIKSIVVVRLVMVPCCGFIRCFGRGFFFLYNSP